MLPQTWDELLQVVAGSSTVRGGDDDLGLETELLSLGGPSCLDGCNRVGQGAVLRVRNGPSIRHRDPTYHVEQDAIGGEGGLVRVSNGGRHGEGVYRFG